VASAPICTAATAAAPRPASCGLVCRAELPVAFNHSDPIVTVWLNNLPARMTFDTGAAGTAVTREAVPRFGLPAGKATGANISGIGGMQPLNLTTIKSLAVSYVRLDNVPAAVIQMGNPKDPAPADGILGDNILHHFDIDLDLPHYVIRLYQGTPCPGQLPGWTSQDGAVAFDPNRRGHHVIVAASVAGRPVQALIDSGSDESALTRGTALRVGVPQAQLSDNLDMHMFGVGSEQVPGTLNEVASFDLGAEHIAPFDTAVFDPAMPEADRTWDMLLGEDYLQNHKVWISYSTGKVYFAHTW
jgi:predicted aspartyl protease